MKRDQLEDLGDFRSKVSSKGKKEKMLKISSLKVSIDKKEILKGVDLEVGSGQLHVLMGPNGSGKSTLAQVVMGSPGYTIDNGQLTFDKKNIKKHSQQL